jgi:hypothetical protein
MILLEHCKWKDHLKYLQIWTDFFDKSQPEKFLFVYAKTIEAGKFLETFNVSKENVLVNLYFFFLVLRST